MRRCFTANGERLSFGNAILDGGLTFPRLSRSVPHQMKKPKNKSPSREGRDPSFFWWEGDTLVVNILGKPSARSDAIGKVRGNQLMVSVTAAPKLGRATDHMVRFLADEFGVSPSAITVVFGRMNVNKQLRINAPANLPAAFRQLSLL